MNKVSAKANRYEDLVWGIGGGLLICFINLLCSMNVSRSDINPAYLIDLSKGKFEVLTFLIAGIFLTPYIEELIFRVYLYRKVRDKFNWLAGYFVSTGLFVSLHLIVNTGAIFFLAIHSSLITYIYQKTDSFRAIYVAHCLWNVTWYVSVYTLLPKS